MTTEEKLLKLRKLADAMYYAAQYLTTDASRLHKAMDEYHKFIIHECKEEPVSNDFEMALAEMIYKAQTSVVEPLVIAAQWKDELIKLAKSEEPVSEDLGQAIDTYLATYFGGEKEKQNWPFLKKMAIYFANWQKQQFEKNRLKHCDSITNEQAELESDFIDQHLDKYNRMPTFLDAIEYGMKLQKEQVMKEAVYGFLARDVMQCLYLFKEQPNRGSHGYLFGKLICELPKEMFPEIGEEDNPAKAKLIIIKED